MVCMLHLAELANEGLEQIQADSYIGIEIRRLWALKLYRLSIMVAMAEMSSFQL